jgi:lysophospholipase L1-like esterase
VKSPNRQGHARRLGTPRHVVTIAVAIVCTLVAAVAAGWMTPAHADTSTTAGQSSGGATFVAMGDSYTAGTGTYDNTGHPGEDAAHRCDRSDLTYAGRYVNDAYHTLPSWLGPKPDWKLIACDGATTDALNNPWNGDPPQLQSGALGPRTKLVTVTIGGNDVKFADILNQCLNPYNGQDKCWASRLRTANDFIDRTVPGLLDQAYKGIEDHAPNAHILVLTYPDGFPLSTADAQGKSCSHSLGVNYTMSQASLDGIHRTWHHLNAVIEQKAAEHGLAVLDEDARFGGHDFCQEPQAERFMNGLRQGGHDHDMLSLTNFDNESFHPTTEGYRQMADDLEARVLNLWGK